jgi:hypothetical protein
VGAGLMASGRGRAIMAYGWSHFICYAGAVLIAVPLGITAVAVAASLVHTAFVVVAYAMLLHDRADSRAGQVLVACKELVRDAFPASVSCLALTAVAVPLSVALSSARAPALLYLVAVGLAGLTAYLGALRRLFPESLRTVLNVVGHVLPRLPWPRAVRRSAAAPAGSGTS